MVVTESCVDCSASGRTVLSTVAYSTYYFANFENRFLVPSIRGSHFKVPHCEEWVSALDSRRDSAHVIPEVHNYRATQF